MLSTDAALYLPLSDTMLSSVCGRSDSEGATAEFDVPQLASLLVVQDLILPNEKRSLTAEQQLSKLIKIANKLGVSRFRESVASMLDKHKIAKGQELLPSYRIVLLGEEEIRSRRFLTRDGSWDCKFVERYKAEQSASLQPVVLFNGEQRTLSWEQTRVFREVKAQADDHMHVQGYAGTGKSYLIKSLLVVLCSSGARVLVLAGRQAQLSALLAGMETAEHVEAMTFGRLASVITPKDLTALSYRRLREAKSSQFTLKDEEIVRHLGIRSIGNVSDTQIAIAVRKTVFRFCDSGDYDVEESHIPAEYKTAFDQKTASTVVHHASALWNATIAAPSRDFRPPVRDYHRVKWAALNRWRIPDRYTHVLIDECHDLSKAMLQILDSSRQAVISLGDEYQNLQGKTQQRSTLVRQRHVTQSVRSGPLIEGIVNPIISTHPGTTKLPFRGNPLHKTDVTFYESAAIPDKPAVVLVSDMWSLFEWSQRLAHEILNVQLLSSKTNLNDFVNDCIDLYERSTRPRHGELFRFTSWDSVAEKYSENPGFRRIDQMLRKGYSYHAWQATLNRLIVSEQRQPGVYAVGLIEDVRNREYDAVMIVPEAVERFTRPEQPSMMASAGSAVYVGVTRAQRRLIVPKGLWRVI